MQRIRDKVNSVNTSLSRVAHDITQRNKDFKQHSFIRLVNVNKQRCKSKILNSQTQIVTKMKSDLATNQTKRCALPHLQNNFNFQIIIRKMCFLK